MGLQLNATLLNKCATLKTNHSGSNNTSFPIGAVTDIKQFAVANLNALHFITKLFLKQLGIMYHDFLPQE